MDPSYQYQVRKGFHVMTSPWNCGFCPKYLEEKNVKLRSIDVYMRWLFGIWMLVLLLNLDCWCILSTGTSGINFNEIWINIQNFQLKKYIWKCRLQNDGYVVPTSLCQISSAKWRPNCLGLGALKDSFFQTSVICNYIDRGLNALISALIDLKIIIFINTNWYLMLSCSVTYTGQWENLRQNLL